MPVPKTDEPDALPLIGGHLQTSQDVARLLRVRHAAMIHCLYKAPDSFRYHSFEIPKRTGGMRRISAPRGLLRQMQDSLLPMLQAGYAPHPSAHGFIAARNVVSNARSHTAQRLVLNIDLEDFFPSINFGRVRGLFLKPPFSMGPPAATVLAQICSHRNGLPQGAPTSPVLSNLIAATLDRRLTRLARGNRLHYSRYADDITLSGNQPALAPIIAEHYLDAKGKMALRPGEALAREIALSGFTVNQKKVRLQRRGERQVVTGITVNEMVNVERTRVRRIRAMIHAWRKFGLAAAAREHFVTYREQPSRAATENSDRQFRNIVHGELAYLKMVRGAADPLFLKLCANLINLDPNPSRFIREMAFGSADFDIFISHASEDKETIARPIYEACQSLGLKAFLDQEHIGWGESFTRKINTALGAARTVLAIVSSASVGKEWPVAEINTALAMEVDGAKLVVPLMVGKPDLSRLPLIAAKNHMAWSGDAMRVAQRLQLEVKAQNRRQNSNTDASRNASGPATSVPSVASTLTVAAPQMGPPVRIRSGLLGRLFGRGSAGKE
jgi:RNA-directed DNA polymerase